MHETADVEFEKHFAMAQSFDEQRAALTPAAPLSAAAPSSDGESTDQRELEAVFTKAIALGLTDEACVATMRSRVESGDFTTHEVLRGFSIMITKHEAEKGSCRNQWASSCS